MTTDAKLEDVQRGLQELARKRLWNNVFSFALLLVPTLLYFYCGPKWQAMTEQQTFIFIGWPALCFACGVGSNKNEVVRKEIEGRLKMRERELFAEDRKQRNG